jgi:hypothetical protein
MSNKSTDALFQLIKSLEKSEKRNFKLYAKRNNAAEELKTVLLFDALDRMEEYDEAALLRKHRAIQKRQLSNLKASLYKQILSSLRILHDDQHIDIMLNELMSYARILYNKGLHQQSLRTLDRLKAQALEYHQFTFYQQALFFEKKIEAMHITRSGESKAELLVEESNGVRDRLHMVSDLSNLSLLLYRWFIQHGHARNAKDEAAVDQYFKQYLPVGAQKAKGFYEELYTHQCFCWIAFIKQRYLQYYRYAQKWVQVFDRYPTMKSVEAVAYMKGLHHLAGAYYALAELEKFQQTLDILESFAASTAVQAQRNAAAQAFVYVYMEKINHQFITGQFTEGLKGIPAIEAGLTAFAPQLDRHQVLLFYYKLACLYFGSGRNEEAIDYLNKIIHWKVDLRTDLQCYARLLHLIAHYELGNHTLLEYLIKSVYRFMAKMENLSLVEEALFDFLRQSFHIRPRETKAAFEALLTKLRKLQQNRFETRAFAYLDVISWLESKIAGKKVEDVIAQKVKKRRNGIATH